MSIRWEKAFLDPGERQDRRNVPAGEPVCWGMKEDFIHSRPGIQDGGAIGGNSFELEGCIDRMQPFLICSSKEICNLWKISQHNTLPALLRIPPNSAGKSPCSAASASWPVS